MTGRVSVKSGTAKQIVPVEGETLSSKVEFTILNTDATATVELVESSSAAVGTGFPLAPGAAWSSVVGPGQTFYVITGSATAVSVAYIGAVQPT